MKSTKYHSPALDKGLDILEYLSIKQSPQSQTEIAESMGRSSNEIYRMLVCLKNRGYISKSEDSGKFGLTLKLFNLGHRHSKVNSIRMAAFSPLQELSYSTKCSSHLSILHKHNVLIIAQGTNSGALTISVEEGSFFPVFETNSGKVILSNLEKNQRLSYLNEIEAFKKLKKVHKEKYLKELQDISEAGHSICDSQEISGVVDIIVPFRLPEIGISGALAVVALMKPGEILNNQRKMDILFKAKAAISQIDKNLGRVMS